MHGNSPAPEDHHGQSCSGRPPAPRGHHRLRIRRSERRQGSHSDARLAMGVVEKQLQQSVHDVHRTAEQMELAEELDRA